MSIFLETKRLILKDTELSDFDNILALRTDANVARHIRDGLPQTPEQVKNFFDNIIAYQARHGFSLAVVFEKTTGTFVGQAGLFQFEFDDAQPEMEVGYRLHEKFWGKGYATELVKALVDWGFKHLSIEKIVAVANVENIASQKVLIKASFFCREKLKRTDSDRELFKYEIYKKDSIELVDYDPEWPKMAAVEIKQLSTTLPKNLILDIQHVGSTAIPGMCAKPIIDIQIAVASLAAIKQIAIDSLKTLGYEYWYDNPDPERMFFVKGMPPFGEKRTHHVHIVEHHSKQWEEKIVFRDYLRANAKTADEYQQLKRQLAQQYTYDREQYTATKTNFIKTILFKAR